MDLTLLHPAARPEFNRVRALSHQAPFLSAAEARHPERAAAADAPGASGTCGPPRGPWRRPGS